MRPSATVWVHPYDDPHIIAGQGTIALEMLEEVPDLDVLVDPDRRRRPDRRHAPSPRAAMRPSIEIVGVECALYPSMWNALHTSSGHAAARRWPKASP